MNARLKTYLPFFVATMLLWTALAIIYPSYQYYIDPDGVAYLTIASRYAHGDWATAINGYWSPWSCWLAAILIKAGMQPIPASVVINALGAAGFLWISLSLFIRCGLSRSWHWGLSVSLAVFLCYAVFWQSFDDLWECFFLLAVVRMVLADNYCHRPALWVLCGLAGTLAYFAKSYSFPFFILHITVCTWLLGRHNKVAVLKPIAVAVIVMIAGSLPWILALHHKYGIWITSTAGSLNMSWYLVGHPQWKEGIRILLPPPYPGSPYYWEDPYMVNGPTPHFWNSLHLAGLQIVRIGLNLGKLFNSLLQLSVCFPVLLVLVIRRLWVSRKRPQESNPAHIIIAISFLLFPLGYLLINYEARYLWYMLPLGLAIMPEYMGISASGGKEWRNIAFVCMALVAWPVWGLFQLNHKGYEDFQLAERLRSGLHGSFASNVLPGAETQGIIRTAYFAGLQYYSNPLHIFDEQQLVRELKYYHINYYIYFPGRDKTDFMLHDEHGQPFPQTDLGKKDSMKIFIIK